MIGDDNSINSFDGKTDQVQGQQAQYGVSGDPTYSNQAITPQLPFSRCVPGPLSLRQRFNTNANATSDSTTDGAIRTSPAYSVTKDNTAN